MEKVKSWKDLTLREKIGQTVTITTTELYKQLENYESPAQFLEKYPLAGSCDLWKRYLQYFDGTQALLLEFMPDDQLDTLETESAALLQIAE